MSRLFLVNQKSTTVNKLICASSFNWFTNIQGKWIILETIVSLIHYFDSFTEP